MTSADERALLRERVWLSPRVITKLNVAEGEKLASYLRAYVTAVQTRPFRQSFR